MQKSELTGLGLLVLILMALPLFLPNSFYMDLAIRMAINATIVIGLNLLIGYAGQISLGHAGFLGIGAYASAVLPTHFGISPPIAMLCGAALAALTAGIVARPIFKLRGNYLAMATLGLGIIINIAVRNEAQWTGGPDGMPVAPFVFFGLEMGSDRQWYTLVSIVLTFSVWASLSLIDSPFGRALRALHGSEVAAQVVGINVVRYKVSIFVLSAVFASIMGSITAHYVGFVTPNLSDFSHSVELVTMVVIGGMASVFGSIIGAVLLTALPQALAAFEGWETVVYGGVLMLCMIFMPKGLLPTLGSKLRGGN